MVRKYTDKELLDKVQELDSFNGFPEGIWILGVRSKADKPNKFDDKFYVYKNEGFVTMTTGTTNPGLSILKGGFKKYNKVGAAVIKSNEWYYDIYKYEDRASRDNQEFAHTDGKKVIQKDNKRVPRFKTKLEELIWIAQQKNASFKAK